jgi:site-specific DNA recombinase
MMRHVKSGKIDIVIVTKLDRITRSIADLIALIDFFKEYDIHFVSITENIDSGTAYGRFMRHLLGLLAQLEREVTAERVSTDMRHRATRGKWNGGIVPFGYMTQGLIQKQLELKGIDKGSAIIEAANKCPEPKKLYVDEVEAEIVRWIFDKFIETNSVRRVTHLINTKGIRTRRESLWATSSIHRVLSNPTYVGKIWYGKRKTDPINGKLINQDKDTWTVVEGDHEAIIPENEYNTAQKQLLNNYRKPTRKGRKYLLTGILKCGFCGGSITGYSFTRKQTGTTYSYYKCINHLQKGKTACKGISLPMKGVNDFVIEAIKELSQDQKFLNDKKEMIEKLCNETDFRGYNTRLLEIEKNIKGLKRKLSLLLEKLESEIIDDEDFNERYTTIKKDLQILKEEKVKIKELFGSRDATIKTLNASFEQLTDFYKVWGELDEDGKIILMRSIVNEVMLTNNKTKLDIFLDFNNVSRTVRGSWRQSA